MSTITMSEEINRNRRRCLRNAAMTLAAAELATIGSVSRCANRQGRAWSGGCPASPERTTGEDHHRFAPRRTAVAWGCVYSISDGQSVHGTGVRACRARRISPDRTHPCDGG